MASLASVTIRNSLGNKHVAASLGNKHVELHEEIVQPSLTNHHWRLHARDASIQDPFCVLWHFLYNHLSRPLLEQSLDSRGIEAGWFSGHNFLGGVVQGCVGACLFWAAPLLARALKRNVFSSGKKVSICSTLAGYQSRSVLQAVRDHIAARRCQASL